MTARPVVPVEITGTDPEALRSYAGGLFERESDTSRPIADTVSEPGRYGVTQPSPGIPGGVGGGAGFTPGVLFYVGVPDVEAALARAVRRSVSCSRPPRPTGRFAASPAGAGPSPACCRPPP